MLPEATFAWLMSPRFGWVFVASIAVGILCRVFVHGDYAATLAGYISFSVLVLVNFPYALRTSMLGDLDPKSLSLIVALAGLLGAIGGLLQLLPSEFCRLGCRFDTLGLGTIPLALAVTILAPFTETLIYFGAVQTISESLLGKVAGFFVTTGIFALAHAHMIWYTVLLGALMAAMRTQRLPLLTIFATHVLANAVVFAAAVVG